MKLYQSAPALSLVLMFGASGQQVKYAELATLTAHNRPGDHPGGGGSTPEPRKGGGHGGRSEEEMKEFRRGVIEDNQQFADADAHYEWIGTPEFSRAINSSPRLRALEKKVDAQDEAWLDKNPDDESSPPETELALQFYREIASVLMSQGVEVEDAVKRHIGMLPRIQPKRRVKVPA